MTRGPFIPGTTRGKAVTGPLLSALGLEDRLIKKVVLTLETGEVAAVEVTRFLELDPDSTELVEVVERLNLTAELDEDAR